jgi:predicted ATPase
MVLFFIKIHEGTFDMFLKLVQYKKSNLQGYPFHLPLFQSLEEVEFKKPVTILVGENGSGKSTFLEALVLHANLIMVGSNPSEQEVFMEELNRITPYLKLTWNLKTKNGFFLRSEDFIGFIRRISDMKKEAKKNLQEINDPNNPQSSYAKSLASLPHNRTLFDLQQLYGDGLEFRSHGEGFLDFFQSRFKPNGFYILDEPEVPLSPMKQLTLISMLKEMIKENAQFVIATHSPILMAFPDADIISFDHTPPERIRYEELEHVQITKSFLENPERYLRHL